jgi:2-furoyl-CoA dehydrogenase large subunit
VAGGLALQASGTVDIAAPPERVFAVLLDPQALARVIPGLPCAADVGPEHLPADVTVGVGSGEGALRGAHRPERHRRAAPPAAGRLGPVALGTGAGNGTVRLEATA